MAKNQKKESYSVPILLTLLFCIFSISSLESYSRGLFSRGKRFGTATRETPLTSEQHHAKQEQELSDTLALFRVKTVSELHAQHEQIEQLLSTLGARSIQNAIQEIKNLQEKLERKKLVIQNTKELLETDSSKQIGEKIADLQEIQTTINALAAIN